MPHLGQYRHKDFADGVYWSELKNEDPGNYDVEELPLGARDMLNPEQRLIYDTVVGHYREALRRPSGSPPLAPLRIQVDGGRGTGKSYMAKVLSAHLQAAAPSGSRSPIVRTAPTSVASNQIFGVTLHSLLRLPISGELCPLRSLR